MDKFVVRLTEICCQGNGSCDPDPQSSNANSRLIAQNAFEKPCPRTEPQLPHSYRNEHEFFPPRQRQIVLDAKKGGNKKGNFNRTFQGK